MGTNVLLVHFVGLDKTDLNCCSPIGACKSLTFYWIYCAPCSRLLFVKQLKPTSVSTAFFHTILIFPEVNFFRVSAHVTFSRVPRSFRETTAPLLALRLGKCQCALQTRKGLEWRRRQRQWGGSRESDRGRSGRSERGKGSWKGTTQITKERTEAGESTGRGCCEPCPIALIAATPAASASLHHPANRYSLGGCFVVATVFLARAPG